MPLWDLLKSKKKEPKDEDSKPRKEKPVQGTLGDELKKAKSPPKQKIKQQGDYDPEILKNIQQIAEQSGHDQDAGRRATLNAAAVVDKKRSKGQENKNAKIRSRTLFDNQKNSRSKKVAGSKKKVPYRIKGELFVLYDYYKATRILGSGAYAVVCEAVDLRTGRKVAIKKNKDVFQDLSDAKRILREVKLLMHFSHDDVIKLIDVIPPDESEIGTFSDVYLVMPKMETNLARVIKSSQKLTKRHIQFFLYQMFRGLKYIHSANVVHRDLKPENILVNGADCNLKITDFGLARGVCNEKEKKGLLTEYVVTRWYRAPEVMCSARQYDEKVDMWSIGCILAELFLRKPVFPGKNHIEQLKIIFRVLGTPDLNNLAWVKTPEAKKWIQGMKKQEGKDMNALFEVAGEQGRDILMKLLALDPTIRFSVEQCLEHAYMKELHNPKKEPKAEIFNIAFEYESSINTTFGVRHMMFEEFTKFNKIQEVRHAQRKKQKALKKLAQEKKLAEQTLAE